MLDARNFFSTTGIRPAVKQNQFGFTLGGRGLPSHNGKDRTFIFGDYEGTRVRRAQTFTSPVPTAAMRQTDFSGLCPVRDHLPASRLQVISFQPTGCLRKPRSFALLSRRQHRQRTFNSPGLQNTVNKFDLRVDHHFSAADALTALFLNNVLTYRGSFAANGRVHKHRTGGRSV